MKLAIAAALALSLVLGVVGTGTTYAQTSAQDALLIRQLMDALDDAEDRIAALEQHQTTTDWAIIDLQERVDDLE